MSSNVIKFLFEIRVPLIFEEKSVLSQPKISIKEVNLRTEFLIKIPSILEEISQEYYIKNNYLQSPIH